MFPSVLTAFFFSLSSVCASRSARLIGSIKANFYRLIFAFCCLALYAYVLGKGHAGPGLLWFMLSGAIGVGLGDTATFLAIRRIGPRLTVMLVQCLTAPFGAIVERWWLGTALTPFQMVGAAIILLGSGLALWPEKKVIIPPAVLRGGIFLGILGAFGQAVGAVITRKADTIDLAVGIHLNGMTAAYQRMLGAIIVGIIIYGAVEFFWRRTRQRYTPPRQAYKDAAPWIVANASAGLVLGVSCYQWALQSTATGIVLAIVATTPLMIMPLAYFIDGDRPTNRAISGGIIAVIGVMVIKFLG